ncbi:MAG: DnaA/Hda family protein [Pseudomonadota bacterium]
MDLQSGHEKHVHMGEDVQSENGADADVGGRDVWALVQKAVARLMADDIDEYERWVAPLRFVVEHHGTALIAARTLFGLSRVTPEYERLIEKAWAEHDKRKRPVRIVCWRALDNEIKELVVYPWADDAPDNTEAASPSDDADEAETSLMGPSVMRFETLVVGDSNSIAATTAEQIIEGGPQPASIIAVNGPQGVGKTHILKSIEKRLAKTGRKSVAYISAGEFMVAYVDGAINRDTRALKSRVRSADVVLFDDLQNIAGKKGTNSELAATLREVTERGGLVVMTADMPPADLEGLSQQVSTVLRGAASIEVELPDDDMRFAIVRQRADMLSRMSPNFVLDDAFCEAIVQRVYGPGRDLCGALLTLYADTRFGNVAPTLAMLDAAIERQQGKPKPVSLNHIKLAVEEELGVPRKDLIGPRRYKQTARARSVGMYLSRLMTPKSYPQIGIAYGKRHHTTVLHNVEKVKEELISDPMLAADVERVQQAARRISATSKN